MVISPAPSRFGGRVLAGDDPLAGTDVPSHDIEQCRFPGPGTARDQDVQPDRRNHLEDTGQLIGNALELDEVFELEFLFLEGAVLAKDVFVSNSPMSLIG